jgi:hypothetical protein
MQLYDMKELAKKDAIQAKVDQEKLARFRQIVFERKEKKLVIKEEKNSDMQAVKLLKDEIEKGTQNNIAKRENEKMHLLKMLEENEENKKEKFREREKVRQQDIRSQEEYAQMLDQQEADRVREFKNRMKRMQGLMDKMADTVVADQKKKQMLEDESIRNAFIDKEENDRLIELKKINLNKQYKKDNK